jgi:phospho-N-acetylmuramoyl-pentapeptide-transferase
MQVVYFKATGGKRIFLMAPVHHHFQEKGFSECKISYAYAVVTALVGSLCVVALL